MTVLSDALLLLGLAVITTGLVGLYRLPDVYTQLHAAGKIAALGVLLVLAGTAATGTDGALPRALLVAALVLVTTPVASHVIARAAFLREEPLQGHPAIDESGRGLDEG